MPLIRFRSLYSDMILLIAPLRAALLIDRISFLSCRVKWVRCVVSFIGTARRCSMREATMSLRVGLRRAVVPEHGCDVESALRRTSSI
eukprot:5297183-Pyramimonas_sp.AAC.1